MASGSNEDPPIGMTVVPGRSNSVASVMLAGHNDIVNPYNHPLLRFFTPAEAAELRKVHEEFEVGVGATRFNDLDTPVTDFRRWRAANRSAVSLRLSTTANLTDFAAFAATGALAEGPDGTEGLQRLTVRRRVWDRDVGATALAAALHHLPVLQELDASESMISDAGVALLAAGLPSCRALTTLKLNDNNIRTAGVAALAAVLPRLPNLTTLELALNAHMGDAGAAALAAALPGLPTLTRLDLSNNELTAAGLRPLLQALRATFHTLRLDGNPLGPEGARDIAALVPRLPALQALNVKGCRIGNEGIQALVEALRGHAELTELDLGESRATEDAVRAVVDLLPTLRKITLVGFRFGDKSRYFYEAVRDAFPGKAVYVPPGGRVLQLKPRRRERRKSRRRLTRRRLTRRRLTRRRSSQRNDRRNDQRKRRESQAI